MTEPHATAVTTEVAVVPEPQWAPPSRRPLAHWIVAFVVHLETAEGKSKSTVRRRRARPRPLFPVLERLRTVGRHAGGRNQPDHHRLSPLHAGGAGQQRDQHQKAALVAAPLLRLPRAVRRDLPRSHRPFAHGAVPLPPGSGPHPGGGFAFLEASKTTSFPTRDHAIFRLF